VIVEFKRNLTNREAVAQILDYASWLDTASEDQIEACAQRKLGKSLSDSFYEYFGNELQSLIPQNHRLLLVAPKLDSSAERIVNYLAERYRIKINAIFFRYAKINQNEEILVRTVLVPDELGARTRPKISTTDLLNLAKARNISNLVAIFREFFAHALAEEPTHKYAGSFRYWIAHDGRRMILGLNVAGSRRRTPLGEFDVWIPVPRLAEVVSVPEAEIRNTLHERFAATDAGATDCIVRLSDPERAQELVSLLREWLETRPDSPVEEASSNA
jgi:hypothetical protein